MANHLHEQFLSVQKIHNNGWNNKAQLLIVKTRFQIIPSVLKDRQKRLRIYVYIVIVDLEATSIDLDTRVTVLEENGGDDGNSSVADLEVRVETLEGTVEDHETRISVTETDVTGKQKNLKTKKTAFCTVKMKKK